MGWKYADDGNVSIISMGKKMRPIKFIALKYYAKRQWISNRSAYLCKLSSEIITRPRSMLLEVSVPFRFPATRQSASGTPCLRPDFMQEEYCNLVEAEGGGCFQSSGVWLQNVFLILHQPMYSFVLNYNIIKFLFHFRWVRPIDGSNKYWRRRVCYCKYEIWLVRPGHIDFGKPLPE